MALTETSRLHQIIIESDETGALSRVFRHDLNLILKDSVEINRSLHILPLEMGDDRVPALIGDSLASALVAAEAQRTRAEAAKAEAEDLRRKLDDALAQIADLRASQEEKPDAE